jgi:hypothetical protein
LLGLYYGRHFFRQQLADRTALVLGLGDSSTCPQRSSPGSMSDLEKTYGGMVGHWNTVMQVISKQQN